MILLLAVLIGLAATVLRARLTHRTLKLRIFRWEWLIIACVIPQILVFQIPAVGKLIPELIIPTIQVITMGGLVVFAVANLAIPGFWLLGLGLLSNFVVILANKGWMPISLETITQLSSPTSARVFQVGTRLGNTKDWITPLSETNLIWLSDFLIFPEWIPVHVAFSLGDIFISLGAIVLLWSLSQKGLE